MKLNIRVRLILYLLSLIHTVNIYMSPYIARARAISITLSWIRWMVFHNLQFVFCQVVCNIYCIICFYFFSTALCRRQKDQLRICKQEIDFWYMGFKMSLLHHIFTIIEKLHLVYPGQRTRKGCLPLPSPPVS